VYVVVTVGATPVEPEVPTPPMLLMEQDDAFVELQEMVELLPLIIFVGFAEMLVVGFG
jgi:hypothetical protein